MIEKSEYKGRPVLILKRDANDKYPFTFGPAKARIIMEHLDEIRAFLAEHPGQH